MRSEAHSGVRLRRFAKNPEEAEESPNLDFSKKEDGTPVSAADHLRSQIALKKELLTQYQNNDETELAALDEYEESLNADAAQARTEYDAWYKALKRPAYFEVLKVQATPYRQTHLVDSRKSADAPAPESESERGFRARVKSFFKKLIANYSPALLPIEAVYAYAGFIILTPHDPKLAAVAAAVFAASLALCGAIGANFALRAFVHQVEPAEPGPKPDSPPRMRIVTRVRIGTLLTAILCFAFGMTLVIGGADLRSKIPHIEEWRRTEDVLKRQRIDSENVAPDIDTETPSGDATPQVSSDEQQLRADTINLEKHEADRDNLLRTDWKIQNSDELIAIGLYFTMLLAAAAYYVFSRDPYIEYAILAENLAQVRTIKSWIQNLRQYNRAYYRNRKDEAEAAILELRSQLWLLNPDDSLALSPYSGTSTAGFRAPNKANADAKDTQANLSAPSHVISAWIAERVARYTRWYLMLRRKHLLGTSHADSIRTALEGKRV